MHFKQGLPQMSQVGPSELEFARKMTHWNGCKFINATVVHLTSSPSDLAARRVALTHTSHSLGTLALVHTPHTPSPQRPTLPILHTHQVSWSELDSHLISLPGRPEVAY